MDYIIDGSKFKIMNIFWKEFVVSGTEEMYEEEEEEDELETE